MYEFVMKHKIEKVLARQVKLVQRGLTSEYILLLFYPIIVFVIQEFDFSLISCSELLK